MKVSTLAAVLFALAAAQPAAAQVQVDVNVGSLEIRTLYNGDVPSATGAVCNFSATLGPGNLGGFCDRLVTANIPVGTYMLSLGYAFGGTLLPPVPVTIVAGQTTVQTFDVSAVVGIVTGTLTVNGGLPPSGYGVCGQTNGKACSSRADGTFALMLPPGSGQGFAWGDGCECIQKGTFTFDVAAGQTRDIGNVNIVPGGNLTVRLTYNGGPPSATGAVCNFGAYVVGVGPLPSLCDEATGRDIHPGSYRVQLGYAFGGPLLPDVPVTITSGQTTVLTFDVTALVGVVTGNLTVNHGQPPSGFGACAQTNGQACGGSADGTFKLMVPAGDGTGFVWGNGCTCSRLGSFSFTAIAGQSVSVGTQDVELGTLKVDLSYLGAAPSATGASCGFSLTFVGVGFLGGLCDSMTTTGIPAGTYQLQLGYGFGGNLGPAVPVTITGGATTTQVFDVSEFVGIISGNVTINGQAPGDGYGVCGMTNGKACKSLASGNGAFKLMLPAGRGSGFVYASYCECWQLGTFSFDVTAGVTHDVGDPLRRDVTPPVLALPGTITAEETGPSGAPVPFVVSASDDQDGTVPVTCSATSGQVFPLGTTTVACTASDRAGNTARGSFDIRVVDTQPPAIAIAAPSAGPFVVGDTISASYECTDSGSGVASCAGPAPSGSMFTASSPGMFTFTVAASDVAGNRASASAQYTVTYGVCAVDDLLRQAKAGSTVPIKVQLCTSSGANLSLPSIVLTAQSLRKADGATAGVNAAGNANPGGDFRYDPSLGGYIFNLKTTGLTTGTWELLFTVPGDVVQHAARFQVR